MTSSLGQIKRLSLSGRLPRFNKHGRLYKKRLQGYEVVPFEQGFPLELFVAIVSLADLPTVSRVTQASFACYQLFMPLLLEDVDVEGEEDLLRVLGPPDPVSAADELNNRSESERTYRFF